MVRARVTLDSIGCPSPFPAVPDDKVIKWIELLRRFARAMKHWSGAGSLSLFVPSSPTSLSNPILIEEGELLPVPELADLGAAEAFDRNFQFDLSEAGGSSSLLSVQPSGAPDCLLVRVPSALLLHSVYEASVWNKKGRRKGDRDGTTTELPSVVWIGLRFEEGQSPFPGGEDPTGLPPSPEGTTGWWPWLLAFGAALARHSQEVSEMLDDSVTGLPGRTEFQTRLRYALEEAKLSEKPLSLLLMNPDGFAAVNERFGREAGDSVIREIVRRIQASHRSSDIVAKYGGVIFASVLSDTDTDGGRAVAEKVLANLRASPFLVSTFSFATGTRGRWTGSSRGANPSRRPPSGGTLTSPSTSFTATRRIATGGSIQKRWLVLRSTWTPRPSARAFPDGSGFAVCAFTPVDKNAAQSRMSCTTRPCTSVSRKSRPWNR